MLVTSEIRYAKKLETHRYVEALDWDLELSPRNPTLNFFFDLARGEWEGILCIPELCDTSYTNPKLQKASKHQFR